MTKQHSPAKKICIAQINYDSENIQGHFDRIGNILKKYRSYDLIVFPELILQGHPSFEKPEGFLYRRMKVVYSALSRDFYEMVKALNARVIVGELKRWGDRYYNLATYVDSNVVDSYTKTHVHWTENFVPGRELKVFDTALGRIGITICFDAAFSEVWRVLALKGADIIVNISAVPKTFPVAYMWRRMTGAAIENQVYVVYANRPGAYFSGHSAVFSPKGDIVATAGPDEEIIEVELDLDEIQEWRTEEAISPTRRPLLYRDIINRHKPELI